MHRVDTPGVARLGVVRCRFRLVAPFAAHVEIRRIVRPAVFEGDPVLDMPPIAGTQFTTATAAACSVAQGEDIRTLLRRKYLSRDVNEGVGHAAACSFL